ncbi:MAG: hypothetical protein U0Q18_14180 [Bryobacteraceae bacterium]
MRFYWLLLGILAVWRVTHLVTSEDGPWKLFGRFRRRIGNGVTGELLNCFYCLSLWISAPVAWWIGGGIEERLILWPALSAGAILLHRITERPAAAGYYVEDREEVSYVLRQEGDGRAD